MNIDALTMAVPRFRLPMVPQRNAELLTELQALGMRWEGESGLSRVGGAGPSDHKAVRLLGQTIMVPIFTHASHDSPFAARPLGPGTARLEVGGEPIAELSFPPEPAFYRLRTADGVPYWKIATLHAEDVLATTVLQSCIRYARAATACRFCAIGRSLAAGATIPRKTPKQLAEVARAAVDLSGVRHMVLTTGTPPTPDRGAALLTESCEAIASAAPLPMQVQCEPPEDFAWFRRLRDAGAGTLGMHLEAVTESVRREMLPGKAEISIERYFEAFDAAVEVFGVGQVTTYVLAGLGDPPQAIEAMAERLVRHGVYPFVVPFVPISGTPLEFYPPMPPDVLAPLLSRVADIVARGGLRSDRQRAGCGRCGACSTLRAREERVT